MILKLARHQFLTNIYTFRFLISFVLCETLFAASAWILTEDYAARVSQYNTDVQNHEQEKEEIYTYSRLRIGIDRPPEKLSILCQGSDKQLGTSVTVGFDVAPTITEESGTRNPLLVVFPQVDLTTVIQVILSLLVLLFAYNAISGERERGTLRLVLSNSVSRHAVLLGNIIGGLSSLLLPLFLGFLTAVIIFLISSSVQLNAADVMKIVSIFILSSLYLSMFYALGIFLSGRIKRSATVLIILLFIWVVFVVIVPNTSVYLGKMIADVPDKSEIDNQALSLRREWMRDMYNYIESHPRPEHDWSLIRGRYVMQGDLPYAYMLWYAPREVAQWMHDGSIFGHNLRMEYEDRILQVYRNFQNAMSGQLSAARLFSRASPSWIFYNAVSTIAGTNEETYLQFLDQAQTYRNELIAYTKDKGGLSTYRLFMHRPPEEFLTHSELVNIRDTRGEQALEDIFGPGWDAVEPLNLDDMPQFTFNHVPFSKRFRQALPDIGILIFLNILFFSLAWVSFQKADVR